MQINDEIVLKFGNRLRVRPSGIVTAENSVLLIKHTALNEEGVFWSPPGGGLQFGESITECLKREFVEETNLKISVGNLLGIYEYRHNPLHAVELFFHCHIVGGSIALGTDPELKPEVQIIQDIQFIDLEVLQSLSPSMVHPLFHGLKNISELLKGLGLVER